MKSIIAAFHAADEFHPIWTWPADPWRRLFLKPHKNNNERYRLFAFLYLNGMDCRKAAYWVLWHNTYDASATSDIVGLCGRLERGDPKTVAAMNRNRVFDFALDKVN